MPTAFEGGAASRRRRRSAARDSPIGVTLGAATPAIEAAVIYGNAEWRLLGAPSGLAIGTVLAVMVQRVVTRLILSGQNARDKFHS